jgi:hypothetical protein
MVAGYVVDAGISLSQMESSVVKCVSEKGKGACTTSLAEQVWYDFQSHNSDLSPLMYGDVLGKLDQRLGSSL